MPSLSAIEQPATLLAGACFGAVLAEACLGAVVHDFNTLYTDRRKVLAQDKKKYIQIMMDHMNEIENLLMKAQEEICLKLGINQKQLEDSEMILIERGLAQHILMMQAAVRQRIK